MLLHLIRHLYLHNFPYSYAFVKLFGEDRPTCGLPVDTGLLVPPREEERSSSCRAPCSPRFLSLTFGHYFLVFITISVNRLHITLLDLSTLNTHHSAAELLRVLHSKPLG